MILIFDREIQFYIAYLEYIARFKKLGLSFCYPRVTQTRGEIFDYQGFDLALAGRLVRERAAPVCNDFHLRGPERIIVVSGPNQGGKTTFARTFGQLHYLAQPGLSGPWHASATLLFDKLLAHFDEKRTSRTCAASCRTIWFGSTGSSTARRRTASSS